jgi:hypothetical protein
MRSYRLPSWVARLNRTLRAGGLTVFLLILAFNLVLRIKVIFQSGYLNEDSGLIRIFSSGFDSGGFPWLLSFLHTPYLVFASAPTSGLIRPFQLASMVVEQHLLGFGPTQSHVVAISLFSFGLWILWRALAHLTVLAGQLACIGLLSTSVVSADPLLWLSDRHDVYLLIFSAAAFLLVVRWMQGTLHAAWYLPLTTVTVCGAFLSNEKATALPLILSATALALAVQQRTAGQAGAFRRAALAWGLFAALFTAYFAYRIAVLGRIVGGYDDTVLTDGSGHRLPLFVVKAATTPLLIQADSNPAPSIVRLIIAVSLVGLVVMRLRDMSSERPRRTLIVFATATTCGLVSLVAASFPTYRYFLWEHRDLFDWFVYADRPNSRMFWLGTIVLCVLTGLLFGFLTQGPIGQVRKRLALGLLLTLILMSARDLVIMNGNYIRATQYTQGWLGAYETANRCVSTATIEDRGFERVVAGVHTFSSSWEISQALVFRGLPLCEGSSLPHPEVPATVAGAPTPVDDFTKGFVDSVTQSPDGSWRISGWADFTDADELVVITPNGRAARVVDSGRYARPDVAKAFQQDDLYWSGMSIDIASPTDLAPGDLCVAVRTSDGRLHALRPAAAGICPDK